ncbi:MAG: glycosyltransferase [Lachnospiraceae bacterium]|nr:glycosyltransferase [Lachnospiraceae bacterium]
MNDMNDKIRVLMSVGSLGIGGTEQFVMNLFRNIDRERFDVDFVVFENDRLHYYQEITNTGSHVFFCDSNRVNKFHAAMERAIKVRNVLKQNKYDIIHCHSCSFLGIIQSAIPGKFSKGVKVIAHTHSVGMPKNNPVDKMLRRIVKYFTCVVIDYGFSCSDVASESKYTKRFIESDRHFIIHNAIEVEKFLYSAELRTIVREELSIMNNTTVIGHVGRLEHCKNHEFLLELFSEYIKQNENSCLLLVGDGTLRPALELKAERLGIKEKVIFMGSQDHVERIYNAMDCFVMPSFYEGFPFVVVEAQINGLKVLLSDTITKTTNISGEVIYMSLNDSLIKWNEVISNKFIERIPIEVINQIKDDFDLVKETKRVERLYQKLVS